MSHLILFAREAEHKSSRVDPLTGDVRHETINTVSLLQELGVKFHDMPEGLSLWAGKNGKVTLDKLGPLVLCKIDETGEVMCRYGSSRDFSRPLPISPQTIKQLSQIFSNAQATE